MAFLAENGIYTAPFRFARAHLRDFGETREL